MFYIKPFESKIMKEIRYNYLPIINAPYDYEGIGFKYKLGKNSINKLIDINHGIYLNYIFEKDFISTLFFEFELNISNKLKVLYSILSPSIKFESPNFIFFNNLEFQYDRISLSFLHYSDWFLSNQIEYDIIYYIGYNFIK